ncbi:MAG TPA: signal peptidase II [Vicinamibacterales bacterium]|nr:signal peptidase II [Vicinamibacterales bacterium]
MALHSRQRDLWIAAVIVLLDQVVKAIVRSELTLNESVTVIPGFFDLTRVHNTGTAFGFMNATDFPFKTLVLACVAVAALVALAMYAASLPVNQWLARTGLALILGGAAGNLIDRVAQGYVVDFVDLYWSGWHFWAFNVADASITVGVALMILDLLGAGSRHVSRAV